MYYTGVMGDISKILERYNPWWEDADFRYEVLDRPRYTLNLTGEKNRWIDILIGGRRVGKTSIFRYLINRLLDLGTSGKQILFVTSEIRTPEPIILEDLVQSLQEHFQLDRDKEVFLFVDETQDIDHWQRSVKLLYDNWKVKIYLSGSSSLILKPETSKLTGRFFLHEILPLDFSEYLSFKGQKITTSDEKNKKLVEQYLEDGGYPEYVMSGDRQKLEQTIESTLYRDLLSVYRIRNPAFLRDLLDYLSDKVTNQTSTHRIQKDLGVNDDTARFYLQYLQDVYLIYPVFRRGKSHKRTKGSAPKYYFNDTGVLHLRSLNPKIGALAENAVYLELRRQSRQKEHAKIYYDILDGTEVDFYCGESKKHYEVKYRTELAEEDISIYRDMKGLEMIVPSCSKIESFQGVYPEIQFTNLWSFLAMDC